MSFEAFPSLSQAGICYPQDAIYLHGLFMIEQAVAFDKTVLDRLAVGKVALELLPDLQELGITTTSLPSLYTRASDPDLDAYILSFEESERSTCKSFFWRRRIMGSLTDERKAVFCQLMYFSSQKSISERKQL